jgi:hypothetical protein
VLGSGGASACTTSSPIVMASAEHASIDAPRGAA